MRDDSLARTMLSPMSVTAARISASGGLSALKSFFVASALMRIDVSGWRISVRDRRAQFTHHRQSLNVAERAVEFFVAPAVGRIDDRADIADEVAARPEAGCPLCTAPSGIRRRAGASGTPTSTGRRASKARGATLEAGPYIFWVHPLGPAKAQFVIERAAGELEPALVDEVTPRLSGPDVQIKTGALLAILRNRSSLWRR